MGRYRLRLAKPDFKFAAAHFTLFADGTSERLHGHNYRVAVCVEGERLGPDGLLLDVAALKRRIRACCDRLDERVLLPRAGEGLRIDHDAKQTKLRVGELGYSVPSADVVELPIGNVCVEGLAEYLWRELATELDPRLDRLIVEVEETDGQSCAYAAALR